MYLITYDIRGNDLTDEIQHDIGGAVLRCRELLANAGLQDLSVHQTQMTRELPASELEFMLSVPAEVI